MAGHTEALGTTDSKLPEDAYRWSQGTEIRRHAVRLLRLLHPYLAA